MFGDMYCSIYVDSWDSILLYFSLRPIRNVGLLHQPAAITKYKKYTTGKKPPSHH